MSNAKDIIYKIARNANIDLSRVIVYNDDAFNMIVRDRNLGLGESYMLGYWDYNSEDSEISKEDTGSSEISKELREFTISSKRVLGDSLDELLTAILIKEARSEIEISYYDLLKLGFSQLYDWSSNAQKGDRALEVGKQHYDIGNPLFKYMLGETMMYSCAYWEDVDTLNAAQINKMELICEKMKMSAGMRVLDIGCGWGGFSRYLHDKYHVSVVGITISKQQFQYCLDNKGDRDCKYYLTSYEDFSEIDDSFESSFDRVISIGMFEHVGYKNYKTFMNIQCQMLKEDGLVMLHCIVGNESKTRGDAWFEKYIFPNSMLPSMAQIANACEGVFVIEDVHNIGVHYDRTLMAWWDNFRDNLDKINKELELDLSEVFIRMWKYYLMLSAALFRSRSIQLYQIVMSRGLLTGYERSL